MTNLWLAKYAVQRCLDVLPGSLKTNEVLQKTLGGLRKPIIFGYPRTLTMLWLLQQAGVRLDGSVCVELGTGWDMSSAMTLVRTGASFVHTYDHVSHALPELKAMALQLIEAKITPSDTDLPFGPPFEELKKLVGQPRGEVAYHAPFDARATGLSDRSIDFYYSLATLEHIPCGVLKELLEESFRILKPGACCYHYIQPAMHSWRGSESSVDYLIFSQPTWDKWIASSIAYENRLRAVEHLELLKSIGFTITKTWFSTDVRALKKIPSMQLASEFTRFTAEELAQNYVWVVAQKPV
ncbi:MAG: class I SAM-dependent methyltransferase [Candidatus Korobacteraceae bacterium]